MSNIIEFPNREHIEDQASLWIARLDRQLTPAEQRELQQWLASNEMHRTVFFEMAELWDKMDSLARLADLFQAPPKHQTTQWRRYAVVAATISFMAILIGWISKPELQQTFAAWWQTTPANIETIYETAVGEHSNVNLPDGSQLVLNTNSKVRMKYSEAHRLFFLERGEMNIDVAHDKQRPLSVIAHHKVVQAVGTAFNVRIQNEHEVSLLVTDGKVLVAQRAPTKKMDVIVPERLPATAMAIARGEKIVLGARNEKISRVDDKEMETALSWRQGNLVFRGETLVHAVAEINRYTPVQLEIADESLKQERIAGLFKAGDVDGLLVALEQNFHIRHERLPNNKIRLYAR